MRSNKQTHDSRPRRPSYSHRPERGQDAPKAYAVCCAAESHILAPNGAQKVLPPCLRPSKYNPTASHVIRSLGRKHSPTTTTKPGS